MIMPPIPAGSVVPGWGAFMTTTWSNVWAEEESYYFDYEMLDGQIGFGYGFNDAFGLGLVYDNRHYFGGQMDGFIQSFHDIVGMSQNGRDEVKKGLSRVGRVGATTEETKADVFNNNGVTLFATYDLTDGDHAIPAMNMSVSLRYGLESAQGFVETHPLDYGISFGLAKRLSPRWYAHALVSLCLYEHDQVSDELGATPIAMKDRQFGGLLAFGYQWTERTTLLMQYMPYEEAIENVSGLNESSHEIHLGLKYRTRTAGVFEFGVIENAVTFDNSPDFGFHLGWVESF